VAEADVEAGGIEFVDFPDVSEEFTCRPNALDADDHEWFEARPDRRYRVRLSNHAEREVFAAAFGDACRIETATHTTIRLVAPDQRLRRALALPGAIPDDEALLRRLFGLEPSEVVNIIPRGVDVNLDPRGRRRRDSPVGNGHKPDCAFAES
jgi:hypothetical protein